MSTEEQLSLFAAGSPASHSPLPGSKEAQKMTAHSGQKCSESYERFSQLGSLARTFLESSTWNSTACYLTWKPKVTQHKRLLFQLAPSMPSTEEIESGLLGTPTATNKVRSETFREGRIPNPAEFALMHTPTAKANQMAPSMNSGWWPTPAASQGGAGEFIKNLQTKDGQPAQPGERAYNPNTGKHSQITLQRAVKMWPTPLAHLAKENGSPSEFRRKSPSLTASVHKAMWPTPAASDDRDRGNLSTPAIQRRQEKGKQLNLSMVVSHSSGALNPEWVEWLMGFPIGHTDLKD